MSEPQLPDAPYKGLVWYAEKDAPLFFGREGEREIITANLLASRLTVLYGASGVGKSSVLRAGVTHHLRRLSQQERAEQGRAEFAVVVFSAWRDDPVAGLLEQVRKELIPLLPEGVAPPSAVAGSLVENLLAWTERLDGDLLIILDQFEEYFLYHGQEDGPGTFASELPRAINRRNLRASFLIAIREDALAQLDRFKGRIPNLFDNYLRIRHLEREAARAAIERPIPRFNELRGGGDRPASVEPALVEEVLNQVQSGRVLLGEVGHGGIGAIAAAANGDVQIETPYLQLVMTRLWEEEVRAGSAVLRLSTLQQLGGAERIVRTHLDQVMDALSPQERDRAARIFHHLVTPGGTKIGLTAADLAYFTGLEEADLERVLRTLSSGDGRILRSADTGYEIFHDVLASAVLDWRRRHLEQQRLEEIRRQEQQRRAEEQAELARQRERERARLMRGGLVVASVLLLGLTAATLYAFQQSDRAIQQRRIAEQATESLRLARDATERNLHITERAKQEADSARNQLQIALDDLEQAQDSLRNTASELQLALDSLASAQRQTTEALRLAEQRYTRIVDGLQLKQAFLSGDAAQIRQAMRSVTSVLVNEQIVFNGTREPLATDRGGQRVLSYEYSVFPDRAASREDLDRVAVITYQLDHETLGNQLVAAGPEQRFTASYLGTGCLERVYALIEYRDPNQPPTVGSINLCGIVGGPSKGDF